MLATYGDFVEVPLGLSSFYLANHPDFVREIMVTQAASFHKPFNVKYAVKALIGYNLFSSDGDEWRTLRKAIQPAFHTQRIQAYTEVMTAQTEALIANWRDGATIDIPAAMMRLTMGITTKTLFDADLRDSEAGDAILKFLDLFNQRITSLPMPGWLPTPMNREMKRLIAVGDRLLLPLIEERRKSDVDHGDLLSMLLLAQREDSGGILTDHQVRNEILNLFAAGYEVVAYTAAFTLYLVAQHPAVEQRLLAEIDTVLHGRTLIFTDLPHLPYLEQVIKESMRLLPVTTMVARQAVETVTANGRTIRKGQTVLVAPWTLHRRPDIFPDPERFDPDRFSPAREVEIPKHAYIPFATGPRICIGNAFAMLQLRATLATILARYRLTLPENYIFEPMYRFNTRPKNGLPMILHTRN
jgi:cytochrome P450